MTVDRRVREWLRSRETRPRSGFREDRIVVAASGGADSSALALAVAESLRALDRAPSASLVIAHFNHRLRPEADHAADLDVVRAVAERVGAPLVTSAAEPDEISTRAGSSGGVEAAARRLRYGFLAAAATATGARTICTGHTRDDQAETVLMRLVSGIEGVLLSGIPRARPLDERLLVERPLLDASRSEIECYLRENRVQWSSDSSNLAIRHRRNRVRHEMLPQIEPYWPAVRLDLVRLGEAMAHYRITVREQAAGLDVEYDGPLARISRAAFFGLPADARLELLYEVLDRLGLLDRADRPGHAFFAPVLGPDPGENRRLVEARRARIELKGDLLVVGRVLSAPMNGGIFRGIG